jgi:hypothetical protein
MIMKVGLRKFCCILLIKFLAKAGKKVVISSRM